MMELGVHGWLFKQLSDFPKLMKMIYLKKK